MTDPTPTPLTEAEREALRMAYTDDMRSDGYITTVERIVDDREAALRERVEIALAEGDSEGWVHESRIRAALTTGDDLTPAQPDADAGVRRFVALMRRGNPSPAVAAVLDEVEAALTTEEAPHA